MSYELIYPWERNPRLVEITYESDLGAEALADSLAEIAGLMDQSMMPLHTVFNFEAVNGLPQSATQIFLGSAMIQHQNRGWCLFMNPDGFVHYLAQAISNQAFVQIKYVESYDDAWEFFSHMGIC